MDHDKRRIRAYVQRLRKRIERKGGAGGRRCGSGGIELKTKMERAGEESFLSQDVFRMADQSAALLHFDSELETK